MLTDSRTSWLNKVPEVTLSFWLIKMMSTTVGETAADFLNMDLGWGLTNTTVLTGVLFVIALALQLRATRYVPALYWATVLLISVFGTLVTDNLTDRFGVPLAFSTGLFGAFLSLTFVLWFNEERTLSIHSITTRKRELFYWVAILFTFSLGTAAGDWAAERCHTLRRIDPSDRSRLLSVQGEQRGLLLDCLYSDASIWCLLR